MCATLNILISTLNDGISRARNVILDTRTDVSYVISHQYTSQQYKTIPAELRRSDITISQIPGCGVTKSRNNAIRLASGEIGLFSDDDVSYTNRYLDDIINTFHANENLDVAIFKIETPVGCPEYKVYPKTAFELNRVPFSVGTIEIAFKIDRVRKAEVFFDERFGAGQPLLIGSDESIFISDCIAEHLNVWFYPKYVVNHPFESTAKSMGKYDRQRVCVSGAYDARLNGWISIPKAVGLALHHLPDLVRHKKNPFVYLKDRMWAAFYILCTKRHNRRNGDA